MDCCNSGLIQKWIDVIMDWCNNGLKCGINDLNQCDGGNKRTGVGSVQFTGQYMDCYIIGMKL